MIGHNYNAPGLVKELKHGKVVKKTLESGDKIPVHNHPGMDIFFTVVTGSCEVTLGGSECHTVTPGSTLHFDGNNTIEAVALESSDIFVFLFEL